MVFDFVNLAVKTSSTGSAQPLHLDQFGCSSSYISISSLHRPNEDYRLCGQRRGIKLVTTYNIVLIKFITTGLNDPSAGFSMIFRVIQQAGAATGSSNTVVSATPVSIAPPISVPNPTIQMTPPTTTILPMITSPRNYPLTSSTMGYARSMGKLEA